MGLDWYGDIHAKTMIYLQMIGLGVLLHFCVFWDQLNIRLGLLGREIGKYCLRPRNFAVENVVHHVREYPPCDEVN